MSDANVPLPREPDSSKTGGDRSSEWEVPSPWVAKPKPEPAQNHQDWQTVNFPNAVNVDDIPPATASKQNAAAASMAVKNPSPREAELLRLVSDLNQCNDNLLRRVAQLEEMLEHSQAALQAEIERSQEHGIVLQKTAPSPPNPNAQVAQLVSELDSTQQALQRQKILTETLQGQLATSQQRVAQLERESALIQQRYTKQAQAVIEAEATCRDLRSRLQRQQHYTMQFKAALEKSLEMSSHSAQDLLNSSQDSRSSVQQANQSASPQPISMPKAQRIQPWSSDAILPRQAPNLDLLISGLGPSSPGDSSSFTQTTPPEQQSNSPPPYPSSSASSQSAGQSDSEAESLLWRDMERVMDSSRKLSDEVEQPYETTDQSGPLALNPSSVSAASQTEELTFSEPSPWGEPLKSAKSPSKPPQTPLRDAAAANQPTPNINQSTDSLPISTPNPSMLSASIPVVADQTVEAPPALNPQSAINSPSPIVYPLRPAKKIKSLAAVELPNFPRQHRPKR